MKNISSVITLFTIYPEGEIELNVIREFFIRVLLNSQLDYFEIFVDEFFTKNLAKNA